MNDLDQLKTAAEALDRLRRGNEAYLTADRNEGDISQDLVAHLFEHGQSPFACILSCADSRVVPEHIFMAGLGELFTIRVAGNVVGTMELASCLYAAEHLGTKLVLVLGHTHCGAIESAIADDKHCDEAPADGAAEQQSSIAPLLSQVARAIGDERDPYLASVANVRAGVAAILADPEIAHLAAGSGLKVRGAVYLTDSGKVEFLD